MFLLTTNSYAMQININLGKDISTNNNKVNIALDVYSSQGIAIIRKHTIMNINAVVVEKFPTLMANLNNMLADADPIDNFDGKHSQVTMGYTKADGTIVTPANCQYIRARPVTNIELSETGCVVS